MNLLPCLALLLLAVPAGAQAPPERRRDSTSLGLGYHGQGPMVTFMETGPTWGLFCGASFWHYGSQGLPQEDPRNGTGDAYYTRDRSSSSEVHLGVARRLDSRVVVGLGYGFKTDSYEVVLHPAGFLNNGVMPAAPGPLSESASGPVAMVDVRVGDNWGLHLVGGATGAGLAVTRRF
jgi:hypothetical protein